MGIKFMHLPPARSDTERPVPRWALNAAYALPWLLLPVCVWRLPFAFNYEMGMVGDERVGSLWLTVPYVFGLSVFSEMTALLTIGLVRGWGEVAPAGLPLIGGKRVPPWAAIVPGTLGGLALTLISVDLVLGWLGVIDVVAYENVWWAALGNACAAPAVLWGPTILVLTGAYYVRRCGAARLASDVGGGS
ncbi:hypothetical protein [Spirillospora sp. CA-294931]|uniref:hypothetical protein n=1 Tax=Spirillospora sp. CA-294931 TaxID=3240042 RepID=UPI003D912B9A